MMHIIFNFCDQPYAVPNASVRELFKLPKLTAVEQSIACLAGTINCRGKIIPVLDFAAVIGYPRQSYHRDDVVMVLEYEGTSLGLIVSDVSELRVIEKESVVSLPTVLLQENQTTMIGEQAKGRDQEILNIVDVAALFTHPAAYFSCAATAIEEETQSAHPNAHFDWQQFDENDRSVLLERARKIAAVSVAPEQSGTETLAILRLSGEIFGIRLDCVREFTTVCRVTPLPCCPKHIAGSMNLRGDALMLLDLGEALHLAPCSKQDKVVVMHTAELGLFGVLVDDIVQIVRLLVHDSLQLPGGLGKFEESYLSGLAHWGDTEVPVLDIRAMVLNGGMIVNETV